MQFDDVKSSKKAESTKNNRNKQYGESEYSFKQEDQKVKTMDMVIKESLPKEKNPN
jgi:hypothetical protein